MNWTVVIPAKALPGAKSRLVPASSDAAAHRHLVEAIRADTVAATARAHGVAHIVLVVDRPTLHDADPDGPVVLVQRDVGLNGALRDGAALAAARWGSDGVAALVGDLPALRSQDLADALSAAAAHAHAFVADASGHGTTLLTAAAGRRLSPRFGVDSASRHARHAVALPAAPGLRHDVDTQDDLAGAAALGLGPATAAWLASTQRAAAPAAGAAQPASQSGACRCAFNGAENDGIVAP